MNTFRGKREPLVNQSNRYWKYYGWGGMISAALLMLLAGSVQAQNSRPIRIGSLLSMTGFLAAGGQSTAIGARLAVKEINEAGGVLGRKLELVMADDQTDPTATVNEAKRLVTRERVDVIVGPIASGLAIAAAPVLNEGKIASVVNAGSMAFTPEVSKYGFSLLPNAIAQGAGLVNHAVDLLKVKTAAVISDTGSNSQMILGQIKKDSEKRGLKLVGFEEFTSGSTDMTPQLLKLRRTNPDLLLVNGLGAGDNGYILTNLMEMKWNVRVSAQGSLGMQTAAAAKITGPKVFESDRIDAQDYAAFTYCPGEPASDYGKFMQRVKAFDPDNFAQLSYGQVANGYDSVQILKTAMEGARSTEGDKMAAWLERQKPGSVRGLLGKMSASKSNHHLLGAEALSQAVNLLQRREDGARRRAGC